MNNATMPVNVSMNILGIEQLEAIKATSTNVELNKLIDGIIASKKAEAEAAKQAETFKDQIAELVNLLPIPPANVHNFYARFGEVTEEADLPDEEVVVNGEKVMRKPTVTVKKWILITNHACGSRSGASSTSTTTTEKPKRAITVKRVSGDILETIGNFRNAKEACTYLNIEVNGDSAMRKLQDNGYVASQYTGEDFTVAKA
jgi:hypothetical protein